MKKAETACSDIMEEEGSSSQQNNSNSAIQLKILKNTKNQTSLSDSEDQLTKVNKKFRFSEKATKISRIEGQINWEISRNFRGLIRKLEL